MEGHGVFENVTAWFSSSVKPNWKKSWQSNGGKIDKVESAMFLFGNDAFASDIREIFDSKLYLSEHVAIFRPDYIDECLKRGDMKQVCVGEFQLRMPDENDMMMAGDSVHVTGARDTVRKIATVAKPHGQTNFTT